MIMTRLTPIEANEASPALQRGLQKGHLKFKEAPNFLQVMANSPAALQAYILADSALVCGHLTPQQREQIALIVAEINDCSYSRSAHYAVGESLGLTDDEMQLARKANATDPKTNAILSFTRAVVIQRGHISDEDFRALRQAGSTDAQITEIIGNIALNIFSNYFNSVAQTKTDIPLLPPGTDPSRHQGQSATPDGRVVTPAAARTSLPKPPNLPNDGKPKGKVVL